MAYQSMQYKTRGNASPQGRPRVFFCCAAADFDRLFEPVTEELLSVQTNAAIWYLAPGEGTMEGEAFEADLSQMQLLVVPVTTAFLRQDRPDPARTVAFRYAVEHHIPVLPLMQEPGLESIFNELCGDLQFLDKTANDPTAIPYEEKLQRFLEGVLVSDALAKRVRAAFDAYIFLSYRKKDRAAAQKIMRLIHENEFCRDIAIWYDEFLTPGENFNNAIAEAMEKSALFALVVTPHLLEDPNYVMTTEYPAARERRKAILPLEAERTDEKELARLYDGLAQTLPTEAPEAIGQRLRALLTETALRQSDDPAHIFLMGIAYLSGIDMEVNHTRAVQLIAEAAEAGLPEALEKLVSMYKTGEGVERNYHTAIDWQRRLADRYREAAGSEPTEQNWTKYFWALCNLGDDLRAVGDLAEEEKAYQDSLRCAETMLERNHPSALRNLSVSYERLGDVCQTRGLHREALAWYQEILSIAEALVTETETVEAYRDLAVSYIKLGDACQNLGSPNEALEWYQKSLAVTELIASETGTVEARRDLSLSCNRLGDVCSDLGRPSEALEWFQKDHAIAEALAAETGMRDGLSASYKQLGDVCNALGRPSEAREWYQKSLAIDEMIAAESGTLAARRNLSVSYERLGDVCSAGGRAREALEWYQKGLPVREALAVETGMVQARRDLSIAYERQGDVYRDLGRPYEALAWYQKMLFIVEALASETGTVKARRDLVISYDKFGDLIQALGIPSEALVWYQAGLPIQEALAAETGTLEARRDLSVSYHKLGEVCSALNRPTEAMEWFQKDLAIAEALAAETGTFEARRDLSLSYEKLGDVCDALGRPREALAWYQKGLTIREALATEIGTIEVLDDLGVSCYKLGLTEAVPRTERKAYLNRFLQIWRLLLQETGMERYRQFIDAAKEQLASL